MGMTERQLCLVRDVAEGNFAAARQHALMCCREDSTKKNAGFVRRYANILSGIVGNDAEEMVPKDLRRIVDVASPESFDFDRYLVTPCMESALIEIERMYRVAEKMTDLGIRYRNATLLYGVSGTGKTTFAHFLAHCLGLPLFCVRLSGLISSYLGDTYKNLEKVFDLCRCVRSVLLLDEIDAISLSRGASGEGTVREMDRVVTSLIQELDRFGSMSVLIATTNRPALIDDAVMRRLTLKVEVKPLDDEQAQQLAVNLMQRLDMQLQERIGMPPEKEILDCSGNPSRITDAVTRHIAEGLLEMEACDGK